MKARPFVSCAAFVAVPLSGPVKLAAVTFFAPVSHDDLAEELDYEAFVAWLTDLLPSPNLVYALRIEGEFAEA